MAETWQAFNNSETSSVLSGTNLIDIAPSLGWSMFTTDSTNTSFDKNSGTQAALGHDAGQVNPGQIDPIQAMKELLQSDRSAARSVSVSLDSPGTTSIFAKTTDLGPATKDSHGQILTIPPIEQPVAGATLLTGDKQVAPGPWDALNGQMRQNPGPLTFDVQPVNLTGADKLLQHFTDELKDGTLTNDPIWQNYIKSHLPDKNILRDTAVEALEMKKLLSGQPDDAFNKYFAAHPEVNKKINDASSKEKNDTTAEHKKLSDWADKTLKEPERSAFKKDMANFESRAQRDGLSQEEVLKTYQQIERLTQASGDKPLTAKERQHIAQQVMHLAADPTSNSQGFHNTCNVASVESRTYTRDPSDAARLVADVALTGQYKAADGTTVKIDSSAHDQSKTWPTKDGQRGHASEIFQVTAVNLHYAKENAKSGKNIRYSQTDEAKPGDLGDTGERLRDYSTNPPTDVKDGEPGKEKAVHRPDLSNNEITEISDSITGKKEKDVMLQAFNTTKDGVTAVHSQAELQAKLKELKAQHKFPVIVFVDTNNEPFYTDSGRGAAGGSGGAHAVTITDYDEKTGNVCIDNEWDKSADHGKNNPVNIHDLFTAMQFSQDAQKALENDVKWNRAHGTVDPYKETDLIRHELANKTITPAQAEAETQRILAETKDRWAKNNVSEAEKAHERSEIEALIHQLPPEAQERLLKQANDSKVIPNDWYNKDPIIQAPAKHHINSKHQSQSQSSNP